MTPTQAVRRAAAHLRAAGVASPDHDARALACHVSAAPSWAALLGGSTGDAAWPAEQLSAYDGLVQRRAAGEPLQHLTGHAPFRHLLLSVGPGVFVPRPETEVLVEHALTWLRGPEAGPAPVVVDLCTGSGAIALAVATEHPAARVHAVEVEPAAHAWAARNVGTHAPGTVLHLADATAPALPDLLGLGPGSVDAVLSNPPYLPSSDLGDAERRPGRDVLDHDPARALWGGPDGLDVLRGLLGGARALLRPGGLLLVEHDDRHGAAAAALLAGAGFVDVAVLPDLTGRDRFTRARRDPLEDPQ